MNLCFDGLGSNMGNLSTSFQRRNTLDESRQLYRGAKGNGGMATEGTGSVSSRELGRTWKVSPSINIAGKATATLADTDGPGAILATSGLRCFPTHLATPHSALLLGQ